MKILICYDGTELADRALIKAIDVFDHYKPNFILATVADMGRGIDMADAFSTDEVEHELKKKVFEAGKKLVDGGKRMEVVFAVGDPGETLYEIVKKQVPDYIVIGKRELTAMGEVEDRILGSVSEYLIRRTVIPVLICH